jgi:hypothetical protein
LIPFFISVIVQSIFYSKYINLAIIKVKNTMIIYNFKVLAVTPP